MNITIIRIFLQACTDSFKSAQQFAKSAIETHPFSVAKSAALKLVDFTYIVLIENANTKPRPLYRIRGRKAKHTHTEMNLR